MTANIAALKSLKIVVSKYYVFAVISLIYGIKIAVFYCQHKRATYDFP
jgi:hypothetical protein